MDRYYGQNAEDFVLRKLFPKDHGFFVEVGCIDGKVFSNTLLFEELGWKGVCIEAHTGYIEMIKKNRPGSAVVHCAIGEKDDGVVTFYANSRGSLSSLDKSTEERWKRDYGSYFTGFEEQKVEKRTLTSVFDQLKVKEIDFMSLDIEGYEVEALKGLDLSKYKPTVIVVESDSEKHQQMIEEMLVPFGYKMILKYRENIFYSVQQAHEKGIGNKNYYNIPVHRFAHPVDNSQDSDETLSIILTAEKPSLLFRVKRAVKKTLMKIGLK